jgi:hypothetical protein
MSALCVSVGIAPLIIALLVGIVVGICLSSACRD